MRITIATLTLMMCFINLGCNHPKSRELSKETQDSIRIADSIRTEVKKRIVKYNLSNYMKNLVAKQNPTLISKDALERRGNNNVKKSIKNDIDSLVKFNKFKLHDWSKLKGNNYLLVFQSNAGDGYVHTNAVNDIKLTVVGVAELSDINKIKSTKTYNIKILGKLKSHKNVLGVYTDYWADIFLIDCGIATYEKIRIIGL